MQLHVTQSQNSGCKQLKCPGKPVKCCALEQTVWVADPTDTAHPPATWIVFHRAQPVAFLQKAEGSNTKHEEWNGCLQEAPKAYLVPSKDSNVRLWSDSYPPYP